MRKLVTSKLVRMLFVVAALSLATATVATAMTGCSSPSKSKGFDEAD